MKNPLQRINELEVEIMRLAKMGSDLDTAIAGDQCCTAHRAIAQMQLVAVDARMEKLREEMELVGKVYEEYIRRSADFERYRPISIGPPIKFVAIDEVVNQQHQRRQESYVS